jgi:hypothetical protein
MPSPAFSEMSLRDLTPHKIVECILWDFIDQANKILHVEEGINGGAFGPEKTDL